jgi:hypothetical protein
MVLSAQWRAADVIVKESFPFLHYLQYYLCKRKFTSLRRQRNSNLLSVHSGYHHYIEAIIYPRQTAYRQSSVTCVSDQPWKCLQDRAGSS